MQRRSAGLVCAARLGAGVLIALVTLAAAAVATPASTRPAADQGVGRPETFRNPVHDADVPDPFVLRHGDAYYAYATHRGLANIQILRSTDLVRWVELGTALPLLPGWARGPYVWAPSVLAAGAHHVLYYAVRERRSGLFCVSRATSGHGPQGPFLDRSREPLVCQRDRGGTIDPSPFVDGQGQLWLLFKSEGLQGREPTRIWSQRLSADGEALIGERHQLLVTDQAWEGPIIENPSMARFGNHHLLLYSANRWQDERYAVGWASCAGPAGPCSKPEGGPLFGSTAYVAGPGGAELFTDHEGAAWMAYHGWDPAVVGYPEGRRSLRIDRLTFAHGRPWVHAPTVGPTRFDDVPAPPPSPPPPSTPPTPPTPPPAPASAWPESSPVHGQPAAAPDEVAVEVDEPAEQHPAPLWAAPGWGSDPAGPPAVSEGAASVRSRGAGAGGSASGPGSAAAPPRVMTDRRDGSEALWVTSSDRRGSSAGMAAAVPAAAVAGLAATASLLAVTVAAHRSAAATAGRSAAADRSATATAGRSVHAGARIACEAVHRRRWRQRRARLWAMEGAGSTGSRSSGGEAADAAKRALDVVVAGVGLVVAAPVLALLAALVRLRLGKPVLFRQQRLGLNEVPFMLVKFRTMTDECGPDGRLLPDKDRLTGLGRALRASSLDELPELLNVLRGEMSLVGPRPLPVEYRDRFTPRERQRHEVRPGMTGWAQVNGRNALGWDERLEMDVYYVEHRSLSLDLRILARTLGAVLARRGISADGEATMGVLRPHLAELPPQPEAGGDRPA